MTSDFKSLPFFIVLTIFVLKWRVKGSICKKEEVVQPNL